jgi:hypothetical protein
VAWQAITAFAGFFTLVSVFAAPVDLWRLRVTSHQGEPFLATATLAALPEEHISNACLSMGPESDAPDSEIPFLRKANLELDAARRTVKISSDEPITSPALALVLRVQCAGAPLYARHFSALIPPAAAKAQEQRADTREPKRRGFYLSLLPGDSVASVAAAIFPGKRDLQRTLTRQVLAGNAHVFTNGINREVPAGTVLWFPDLRDLRKSSADKPAKPSAPLRRAAAAVAPPSTEADVAQSIEQAPAKRHKPITLERALELGDKPGPKECKQLMELCGAAPAAVAAAPALDDKARALEAGVKELHLKQDSIDQQLLRMEQSLQALQQAVNSAPAQAATPSPPAPPRVEIRTVVKSEPIEWYVWLGLAGLVAAAGIGGVAYGRRGSLSRGLAETDEQLDRMLATAATAMRELESAPRPRQAARVETPSPSAAPRQSRAPPAATIPPVTAAPPVQTVEEESSSGASAELRQGLPDAQRLTEVDHKLESEPPPAPNIDGLSNEVMYEMDQALDNTRSMFTDVDRFIALGRTQNALSLLQFQVHKDPKDRDSWIKLLAIYRQEKMDIELAKAAREFVRHFPNENPPTV